MATAVSANALLHPVAPNARLTYLAFSAVVRRHLHLSLSSRRASSSSSSGGTYQRSDFTNQPYTGIYEPGGPTEGPLKDAYTPPRITPTILKQHLDQFVVGQDRAKKILATAVYNHYQRIQELQRRDEEEEELLAQEERRRMATHPRHPVEGMESEEQQLRDGIRVPSLTRDFERDEDEFPGQTPTTNTWSPEDPRNPGQPPGAAEGVGRGGAAESSPSSQQQHHHQNNQSPLFDPTPLTVEKSNILLLGPSGVGKTLMAKTLARVLEVPFSMSDCTPFTQAGYIGEDAEVCVQRLLAAANYDVARAERGIICLDEIDKIATARVAHGKDVSGEGVQQALLKIIEGTTLQIQAKTERGSGNNASGGGSRSSPSSQGFPMNSPLAGGGGMGSQSGSGPAAQKGETFSVKTDNILFICAGAFTGLHKFVLDRVSRGSFGFGANVRASPGSSADSTLHETVIEGEDELFEKFLPFYTPPKSQDSKQQGQRQQQQQSQESSFSHPVSQNHNTTNNTTNNHNNPNPPKKPQKKQTFNTLDLTEPPDLQKFGLIPELIGRLPITCALSSLSTQQLVSVLTEPRNSLLKQYEQQFAFSSVELRFTSPALQAVANAAAAMGTGARGLRTVMERLLADAMFEVPGSATRYVLVDEEVANRKAAVKVFERGQQGVFRGLLAAEEEDWEERRRREKRREREEMGEVDEEEEEGELERRARLNREGGGHARTFEEYRDKQSAAGF